MYYRELIFLLPLHKMGLKETENKNSKNDHVIDDGIKALALFLYHGT